ncbi:MAG: hypothetical protein Q8L41_09665 [Anaerolineales bacterium]|nr:hypothetical protein [Anaerolineales bacterium]MDP2777942.1 hypothetical protein [Anaerolineales bacterium]
MSNYNYEGSRAPKKQSSRLELWDLLSILTLIVSICIGLYFVAIFLMPNSAFNPFPPSPPNLNLPPTPTITAIQLQPTWTLTPVNVTETPTLLPTFTLEPSPTLVSLVTPSKTPKAPFLSTVTYIDSTIIHPDLGCNWQGVGGTIVDANNADMLRITIRLVGFYNGKTKNELTVSSIAPAYGKSGYEFFLGTVPLSSRGELYIQILDQVGQPLSDNVYIDTFKDCSKNLALVRFKKNP